MAFIFFSVKELANLAGAAKGLLGGSEAAAAILACYSTANLECFRRNFGKRPDLMRRCSTKVPATKEAILDEVREAPDALGALATMGFLWANMKDNKGFSTPEILDGLARIEAALHETTGHSLAAA